MEKELCMITATDLDGVIGNDLEIPWPKLKADLQNFKNLTIGHTVMMGMKTFLSMNSKPLKDRTNIVVTRNRTWKPEQDNILVAHSLYEALYLAQDYGKGEKIWNIGGGMLYSAGLHSLTFDEIHVTTIQGHFEGNIKFPGVPKHLYELKRNELHHADEQNPYKFCYQLYRPYRYRA
nr:Dihydrofolate reductase [uncultured bacterium]AIA16325.1 Dihydrofolate reductase [uncultured bacterium]